MCQWLGAQMHRVLLAEFLPPPPQGTPDLATVLETGVDTFAEWRWKTLDNVTRGLARVEEAIVAALAQVSGVHELASGPDGRAADVLAAGRDPSFWDRARSLAVLTRPMSEFSSWIRGCECHEADRMAGRAVICQLAGCRARSLASRVACVLQELESKRGHLAKDPHG